MGHRVFRAKELTTLRGSLVQPGATATAEGAETIFDGNKAWEEVAGGEGPAPEAPVKKQKIAEKAAAVVEKESKKDLLG